MRAFIIRPFGAKKGIDFERVERELIGPALDHIHAEGRTTGEILKAGNIRIDMFQQLLVADLVVADTSINNANAFYELGIRHALRDKRTLLLRAKTRSPQVLAGTADKPETEKSRENDEVPFDLRTDRYLEYDPANPGASLDKVIAGLEQTMASEEQDSPVFLSLPNLKVQDRSRFLPVPLEFADEVQQAEMSQDSAKLTLLGLESLGFSWESEGLRRVGRALFQLKQLGGARTTWESIRNLEEFDIEANTMLGNIYQRLNDITSSNQALERVIQVATAPRDLAEAHGQLGRNKKQMWRSSWAVAAPEARAEQALRSPLLEEAYQQYLQAYHQDLNSYYPGLNALGLAMVMTELAARMPEAWADRFDQPEEAEQKLAAIKRKREQLAATLQMCLAAAEARIKPDDPPDPWLRVSIADLKLLTLPKPGPAIFDYTKAMQGGNKFVHDAVYNQLKMFSDLGVCKTNVEKALEVVHPSGEESAAKQRLHRTVLFTGHRIDSADRKTPRFPAKGEAKARQAIREQIEDEKKISTGEIVGLAGGANGGDILFHEICEELGIATKLLLALPVDQFVEESVASEDKGWTDRFYRILKKQEKASVLAQTKVLPRWLQLKKGYDIWQRNNLWLLSHALCQAAEHLMVMALWDGQKGDGPGGTENMVSIARDRGARVVILDTKTLFGT